MRETKQDNPENRNLSPKCQFPEVSIKRQEQGIPRHRLCQDLDIIRSSHMFRNVQEVKPLRPEEADASTWEILIGEASFAHL